MQETIKIFKYHPDSRLNVINGVRSLSMLWVIFGHVMSMAVGFSSNLLKAEQNVISNWKFLVV